MDLTTIHLAALIVTAPVILFADHMGFQYFTGRVATLSARKVVWTHRLVFVGLFLLIATGIALTISSWAVWFSNPFFYAKLAFVATLLMNGLFIERLMREATVTPYANLEAGKRHLLMTSGALSGIGWVATVLIGFFGL